LNERNNIYIYISAYVMSLKTEKKTAFFDR